MDTQITTTRPAPTPADRPPILAMTPPPDGDLAGWFAAEAELVADAERAYEDDARREYARLVAEAEASMRAYEDDARREHYELVAEAEREVPMA